MRAAARLARRASPSLPTPAGRPSTTSLHGTWFLATRTVMASLAPAMRDLTSPEGRLRAAQALADSVYGPFDPRAHSAATWHPLPYAEAKGRYLWTDAFGVCNFVTLACETGQGHYLDQVRGLVFPGGCTPSTAAHGEDPRA
jgi:hypothetical protein